MSSLIEKAKDIIAKGEKAQAWQCTCRSDENNGLHASDCLATITRFEESANPADLLPLLRLLVECEEFVTAVEDAVQDDGHDEECGCPICLVLDGPLPDKLRSES